MPLSSTHLAPTSFQKNEQIFHEPLSGLRQAIGWFFAFLGPFCAYSFLATLVPLQQAIFLSFSVGMIFLWIFRSCPYFIASLLLLVFSNNFGLASSSDILQGFYSKGYFLYLGLCAFSCIFYKGQHILDRFAPLLLRYCKNYKSRFFIGLIVFGSFLTAIIPSIHIRLKLLNSLVNRIASLLGKTTDDPFIHQLFLVGFYGVDSIKHMILVGSSLNFLALGIFSIYGYEQFFTFNWLQGSCFCLIIMMIFNILTPIFWFYSRHQFKIDGVVNISPVYDQSLAKEEVNFLIGGFFSITFLLCLNFGNLDFVGLGLFILVTLISLKVLDLKLWGEIVYWPKLFFLVSLICFSALFNALNIDNLVVDIFKKCEIYDILLVKKNYFFIGIMIGSILLRLFLPAEGVFCLLSNIILPISTQLSISVWVSSFVLLMSVSIWFFPYQNRDYQRYVYRYIHTLPSHWRNLFYYNLILNIGKIVSLLLSFPYWRYKGLI